MLTLRRLASSHLYLLTIILFLAGARPMFGQTVTLSNTSRNFGNVAVGSTSAAWSVTLRNSSTTTALLISNIATTGDFIQTNSCPASLAARGSCAISIRFSPTATGSRTGVLTVTDNAAPGTQTVSLSGTGIVPATISPTSRAFGNVGIGTVSLPKTFTVTNRSTSAMSFTVAASANFTETDNCASVAAGASCTINAAFAPSAAGNVTGSISVSYSGLGSPLSVSVTGTGVAPVAVTPTSRAFGNVAVGSISATRIFTVTNRTAGPMAFTITPSAGFAETDNCASVAANGSCTITSTFVPVATGAVSGTIGISYAGFGSPLSVSVTGTGIAPIAMTPASQAFGSIALGTTSVAKAFTVTNRGTVPQALTVTSTDGFKQTNTCGSSLGGNASCSISVTFAPVTAAAVTGQISISYPGLATPIIGTVTGTGIAPVTLTPASLAFSTTQRVGVATAAQNVSFRNRATTPLLIQSIVASPTDYAQTNNCPASLAAGATCTIRVIFTPRVTGSIPGAVTITDSALGSPQTIPLTGAGVLTAIRTLTITPSPATLPKGTTLQFKATATYTTGTTGDVTAMSTWSSLNSGVLSIDPVTAMATGVTAGTTSVTAAVTGTTTTATRAVTVAPPAITSLTMSPASASVAPGGTMPYTVTATYSDLTTGNPPMNTLVLSSDNAAVASIDATGLAKGLNGGTANLKAAAGTIASAPVVLTVTGPALQSITVLPNAPSILKGNTLQFTATGNYSDNTTKDLTNEVVWGSGNTNLTISSQGLATGALAGPASITASWNGGVVTGAMTATVTDTALASIDVLPASITVGLGAQQQYAATGHYTDGTTQDLTNQVTWATGNNAVVGINPTGMATVFATSSSAIPVTAAMNGVTSNPPAWVNALSTLPRVCPDASVDMKVLVIDNVAAGYVDMAAIKQILDFVGTPYTVMNFTDVTPAVLSDGVCHGYFQGIIMAYGGDIYSGNANLYTTLNDYETTFKVRQVNWYLNPTPDYGFNYYTSYVDSNGSTIANFTAAAESVFPMINTATPLKISNATVYLSPLFTPPVGTITPLMTDVSGNVLSAIWNKGNGQEILSQTFDSNQYLHHNLVLAYGLLNWVTKGIFLGDYHVYAAGQVDDFFINDARWVPGTPCTNPITHDRTVSDDPTLPTFRINSADMTALVAWQNSLDSDPLLKGFKLTMAFNGIGTVGNNDWTGLPLPGVANDDLTMHVNDYEQFFYWVTHTYDHPNTLNGLHKSDPGGDLDDPKVDSIDLEILTNLFVASGTTHGGVNLDVDPADTVTPLNFTNFNPGNMVSPGVTGLNDPVVPQYLYANGIRYVVSDTSVIGQPNNGPNPSPNVGIVNSYAPGIYAVPRYPNNIYYNAANWDDIQAEFHCIYGPDPGPAQAPYDSFTAPDILNYTSDVFVVNMLKGDMDPQMFHQPNLHAYDGTNSLISDVYNQTFDKYKAVYKLPVLSWTIDQLAEGMKARNAYNLAGATGTLLGVGTATPSVSITVPPANPGAVIPVTGVSSGSQEIYGPAVISRVPVDPGQTITLPLQ